jgi:hypothetical protein
MDARFVDERIARIISRLKWIEYIRFSCDSSSQIGDVKKAAWLLADNGIKHYKLFVYILVTKDIDCAVHRVNALKNFKGIRLFAQAERNAAKGITPNAEQIEFSQRYVYSGLYRKETWREYCEKRKLNY